MKWTYFVQQKLKVALLLACLIALIIFTNLLGRKSVVDYNRTFSSIYNDRLIPATDIFHLTENLQSKRFLTERILLNPENKTDLIHALAVHDQKIALLINRYEKTFLIDRESASFKKFKSSIANYNHVERSVIHLNENGFAEAGRNLYEKRGKVMFEMITSELSELTDIQSSVGNELVKDSNGIAATFNLLFMFQIIICIVIGCIIMALIQGSKTLSQYPQQNYKLN